MIYVLRNKTYRGVVGVPKGCVSVDISAAPPSVAISILIIIVENWNFIRVSKSKLYTRSYAVQCQLIYIFCVINTNKQGVCLISGKIYYTQHIYKETLKLQTWVIITRLVFYFFALFLLDFWVYSQSMQCFSIWRFWSSTLTTICKILSLVFRMIK